MTLIFEHLRKFDWLLVGAVFLLVLLGLVSLFSLSDASTFPFFQRQLSWTIFAVVLLAIVLLGTTAIRGVEAWLKFGSVFFQPVELAKISLVILLAKFFSKRHIEIYRIRHLLVSGFYLCLPVGLVLLQPDLGSAVVLASIWVAIVLFSGMKLRHFFVLIILGGLLGFVAWNFALAPYQKDRITSFLNPYEDPKGAGYQMIQSLIAVGSGQLFGKGLGYGSQSHLNFLPEAETDFIFAAFAEEWGFAGVLTMISLLFIVLWRIISIGRKASDNFSRLYSLGFAVYIFVQSFIHIGMNMGLLPITGITLPFVSYGGSSLVILLIGVGILQNIKINARREVE